MKTKIKRHSRSVLSVILSICMLVSCMTVGLIATDAARVSNEDASVGAIDDSDVVGWDGNARLLTKANSYTDNTSGYIAAISNNSATFTINLANETIENGYWYFKIKANNSIFCNGETVGTSGGNLAKDSNSGNNAAKIAVTTNNLTGKTLTLNVAFGNDVATVTWSASGGSEEPTTEEPTEEPVVDDHPTMYLYGWYNDYTEWKDSNKDPMVYSHSDSTYYYYKFTLNQRTNEHRFKFWENDTNDNWTPQNTSTDIEVSTSSSSPSKTYHVLYNTNAAFKVQATKKKVLWIRAAKDDSTRHSNNGVQPWVVDSASVDILASPTALNEVGASSTITVTTTQDASIKVNYLTYTLYDSANNIVDQKKVTDGGAAAFAVIPEKNSSTYYATVEATNGTDDFETLTTDNVTITNSAISNASFTLIGRIIDGTDGTSSGNWSKTGSNALQMTLNHGKIFSYFYDPAMHGDSNAKAEFRIAKTVSSTTTEYRPTATPNVTVSTDENSPSNSWTRTGSEGSGYADTYYKLPDNINCYTIYVNESGTNTYPEIWCVKTPGKTVKVVAKDGTIRERGSGTGPHYTLCDTDGTMFADTTITGVNGYTFTKTDLQAYIKNENSATKNNCGEVANIQSGKTINITTTINNADFKSKYYVAGFCINGDTPEVFEPNSTGVYSMNYTIPEEIDENYVEITPIFFLKDKENCITFYVVGFDDVKSSWGNTIAVYPFYQNLDNRSNAFGGYPGQPMIHNGGQYYTQIPIDTVNLYGSNTSTIQGVTLSNYYWDDVHSNRSNGTTVHLGNVTSHKQTYDYDDFYRINTNKEPTSIIYSFKYRASGDNNPSESSITINDSDYVDLTDYYNQKVDLFGNILTAEQQSASKLYVISNGYDQNYSGHYATEWYVYNSSGTFIAKIDPSALLMNSKAAVEGETDARKSYEKNNDNCYVEPMKDYATAYETLSGSSYVNHPVRIRYECEILNNSSYRSSKGLGYSEEAGRSDGRWYYSKSGDIVSADVVIKYCDDYYSTGSSKTFTQESTYSTGDGSQTNKGVHSKCKAYFTNTELNNEDTPASYQYKMATGKVTHNEDKTYNLLAVADSDYVFVGWSVIIDGSESPAGSTTALASRRSANMTFIAHFAKAPNDRLRITHNVEKKNSFNGDGTAQLTVYLFDTEANYTAWTADKTVSPTTGVLFAKEEYSGDVSIPHLTFTDTANNYLYIELKTLPLGKVDSFYEFAGGNSSIAASYMSTSRLDSDANVTANLTEYVPNFFTTCFAVPVSQFMDGGTTPAFKGTGDSDTTYKKMEYVSHLKKWSYVNTYSFPSYRNSYGDQTYQSSKAFTEAEFDQYMKYVETQYDDANSRAAVSYGIDFQTEAKKQEFLQIKSPYEDAFQKDLRFTFTGITPSYYHSNRQLTANVSGSAPNKSVNIKFKFPFSCTLGDSGLKISDTGYVEVGGQNKISYDSTYAQEFTRTVFPGNYYILNYGASDASTNPIFVQAPEEVYDATNEQTLYFQNWEVWSVASDGEDSRLIGKCVSRNFNIAFYDAAIVKPVYGSVSPSSSYVNDMLSISFLENSRDQWNAGGGGNAKLAWRTQGDRIFVDLLASFGRSDNLKLQGDTSTIKAGVVIDRFAEIEKINAQYQTRTNQQYQDIYGSNAGRQAALDFVDSKYGANNVISGDKVVTGDNGQEYYLMEANKNNIDNKNRINMYYGFPNISHSTGENTGRKYYIYRAYAYMVETDGTVSLSDECVYFTFYDIAQYQHGN